MIQIMWRVIVGFILSDVFVVTASANDEIGRVEQIPAPGDYFVKDPAKCISVHCEWRACAIALAALLK